ncbi:MAG: hypothetical protein KQH63_10025 [Desulfobulbaceae bacterium]|nr:hypothetical protein [Desulfobulbaceae bacterium]
MTEEERQYNILVYGIEKRGLKEPSQEVSNRNFKLFFEPFNTDKRFNDFDGVILFQGIFEIYNYEDGWDGIYLNHSYDRNELDKRKKELELLIKKGGFSCFILHKPFVDSYHNSGSRKDLSGTDLCKYSLKFSSFYRKDFSKRTTHVNSLRDEFSRFLELYGAASSYFENYNSGLELREIAKVNRSTVGMILFDREFFIPSLLPEKTEERIFEYFTLLAESLASSFNKLRLEIPNWVAQFTFEKEKILSDKKQQLSEEIKNIEDALANYTQYKKVLLGSGEILVEHVAAVLRGGFSFNINSNDDLKEDLKILNENNEPVIFVEVKGTNRGVKREYINQTDSHRDRAGLDATFPALLLINTHIKKSTSLEDKDQKISKDQIKHAVKIGVLILRAIDLLFLLKQKDNGTISQQEVIEILSQNVGWLRVNSERWEIIQ